MLSVDGDSWDADSRRFLLDKFSFEVDEMNGFITTI
jgi:hypothetical protein